MPGGNIQLQDKESDVESAPETDQRVALRQILRSIGRIGDDLVEWRPAAGGEPVCSRFPLDEWHKIADDIHSEQGWQRFVLRYDFVHVYVCSDKRDGLPFGFVYLFEEEPPKPIVSFHGGGWEQKHTLIYAHALILLLERLLSLGIKVRTSCFNDNTNAFRFLRGLGFVPYLRRTKCTYLRIDIKRLQNSKIYKRLNPLCP